MSEREAALYAKWRDRIHKHRELIKPRIAEWKANLALYRQEFPENSKVKPESDAIYINHYFNLVRTIIPSIYFKNPEVLCDPRNGTPPEFAKVKEQLINYQLERIHFDMEARRVVFDAFTAGYGVMKFGFGSALERPVQITDELSLDDTLGLTPTQEEEFHDSRVTNDDPFALRTPPQNFFPDPLASTLHDARWVIHRIIKPMDQLKESSRYPKSLTTNVQGISLDPEESDLLSTTSLGTRSDLHDFEPTVPLYEIWDRENMRLMVMDEWNMRNGGSQFIYNEPWPYKLEDFPFEVLVFNYDPESPQGIPDMRIWYNPITAMNLLRSMQFRHVKRFNRKFLVQHGSITGGALDQLISDEDGAVVDVNVAGGDVRGAAGLLEAGPLSSDNYNLAGMLKDDLMSSAGTTEGRRGVSERTKTATEAGIQEQNAQLRDSDRLYLVSKFVEGGCKKVLALDQQFLVPSYADFVVGSDLLGIWEVSRKEVLECSVSTRVRVGSSAFMSREVRVQRLLDFAKIIGPQVDPATQQPVANIRELDLEIADAMGLTNVARFLNPSQVVPTIGGTVPPGPGSSGPGPVANPQINQGPEYGWMQELLNTGQRKDTGPMMRG
jgi:hypothetical protein